MVRTAKQLSLRARNGIGIAFTAQQQATRKKEVAE
jgi:hypothetical protein